MTERTGEHVTAWESQADDESPLPENELEGPRAAAVGWEADAVGRKLPGHKSLAHDPRGHRRVGVRVLPKERR
jgi:hypothetical protein